MRTIVDLPDDLVAKLDEIRKGKQVSRAEIIRRAIRLYLKQSKHPPQQPRDEAFGLWAKRKTDALDYENNIRSEWNQP